jgi:hypothetical protein
MSGSINEMKKSGLKPDCYLLDLKSVTISKQELIDDIPILFILCMTDELLVYKNMKGEVVRGSYDKIITANYIFAITQRSYATPDDEYDEKTGGWVVVEWVKHQNN